GGASHAASTTTGSTASSSATGTFTVSCGMENSKLCPPGSSCCFSAGNAVCDECRPEGGCGADQQMSHACKDTTFTELTCNDPSDCHDGQFCCITAQGVQLRASCEPLANKASCFSNHGHVACDPSASTPCLSGSCMNVGYPGYYVCL